MAAGLPVVANPVGMQAELVRHGENGFLADSPEEWVEAIRLIAANPRLRVQMGAAGRKLVRSSFSLDSGVRRWLASLESLTATEQLLRDAA